MATYEVPLLEYLRMTKAVHRKPMVALRNQRIKGGKVIFKSDAEVEHLKHLISHANDGDPIPDALGVAMVPEYTVIKVSDDFDGLDMRHIAKALDCYKENGRAGVDTARCPVHGGPGQSTDSLHIFRESGRWKCQAGCDNRAIYAEAVKRAKEAGIIETKE